MTAGFALLLLFLFQPVITGPATVAAGREPAALISRLETLSVPVKEAVLKDGTLVVRLEYADSAAMAPEELRKHAFRVFREAGASAPAEAAKIVVEFGRGEDTFGSWIASRKDAEAFSGGRLDEESFLAGVEKSSSRSLKDLMASVMPDEDAIRRQLENIEKKSRSGPAGEPPFPSTDGDAPPDGRKRGEPYAARIMLVAAATLITWIACLIIVRIGGRAERPRRGEPSPSGNKETASGTAGTRPRRPWYAIVLPSILALGSAGLIAFAVMMWREDGAFDLDLETLSGWLCAAAASAAASIAVFLFRKARSGATHLAAAFFFLVIFPVLFGLFIYLGDQVFISTADMLLRGDAREKGIYSRRDEGEAFKWFRKAAERGSPEAMERLAVMYEEGRGVPADSERAEEWRRRARAAK